MQPLKVAVLLPAAGSGRRFGAASKPKVETDLAGKPAFLWSIDLLARRADVGDVILAVHPDRLAEFRFAYGDALELQGVTLVPGGTVERWETVALALDRVSDRHTHVAVHDAARPLLSDDLVDRVFAAAERFDAVIPAVPCAGTLKRVEDVPPEQQPRDAVDDILGGPGEVAGPPAQRVVETLDRRGVVEVQTPQVFRFDLLQRAYAALRDGRIETERITDDAGLVESLGEPVYTVEGEATNLKITRPADAELAAALLERRAAAEARSNAERRLFLDEDD